MGESFAHAGIHGITPVAANISLYGGLSGIVGGSVGQELFTDETRLHFGIEDAFVGLVGGQTTATGSRLVWNLSLRRQRFTLGDGFLIANTAGNGGGRANLQSNPRWAADFLGLAPLRWNNTLVEAFHLDPDELPEIDSHTVIAGLNAETRSGFGLELGATHLTVPESDFGVATCLPSGARCRRSRAREGAGHPEQTGIPMRFEITDVAGQSLERWLADPEMVGVEFLWPGRLHDSPHLSTRQYARILRG